uniref:Uncharacterized protein LOC104236661 n=1 Tax=Nicotiana sylvestris TaxID=4096 RepID=A0A1U7XR51_NICSY|nr:PREDICTED: uncharacterized protein LOC104236661 [Nicotiana sylvestris]
MVYGEHHATKEIFAVDEVISISALSTSEGSDIKDSDATKSTVEELEQVILIEYLPGQKSYLDMTGIPPEITTHRLSLEPKFRPEVKYPEWLANVVVVPKKGNKLRMCVDYEDLNKASPKDSF